MKRGLILLAAVALLALGIAGLAQADETWTFATSTVNGDVGSNTHTYLSSPNGVALTAVGETTTNNSPTVGNWTPGALTATNLFGKYTAGDATETGLGLTPTPSNEIQNNTYIKLDVTDLIDKGYTKMTLGIGSIQYQEGYTLWTDSLFENHPGGNLTLLRYYQNTSTVGPTTDSYTLDLSSLNYDSLYISASPIIGTSSDVLVLNGVTAVPLPPSLLLLGSGLVPLLTFGRRRKKVTA